MSEQKKDNESVEEFDETEENEIFGTRSYTDRIYEFLEKEKISQQPKYYIYKYDSPDSEKFSQIDRRLEGDPPDEHEIGIEFGAGRYMIMMALPADKKFPKGRFKTYRFPLHPRYDELHDKEMRKREAAEKALIPPAAQNNIPQIYQVPQQNNIAETFKLLESIITLLAPILKQSQPQNVPDLTALVSGSFQTVNEILKKTTLENFKMMQAIQRDQLNILDQKEELTLTNEKEDGFMSKIIPLLNEWLPKLLGNDLQSKIVQGAVRNADEIKDIIGDQKKLNSLVGYLIETRGIDETRQVLDNLEIPYELQQVNDIPPEAEEVPPETIPTVQPKQQQRKPSKKTA